MLDTAASWNILNGEIEDGKSVDEAMWDESNLVECPSFKIDGTDFGKIAFHRIPIKIPIHIEAILGIEFFQKHLVFLDFANGCAYISNDQDRSRGTYVPLR